MRRLALALLVSGLGLVGCSVPAPSPLPSPPAALDPAQLQPSPEPSTPAPFQLVRITPQEVQARIAQGEAIVLADVRGRGSYDLMHIAGARSLPGADYQVWGPALGKEETVVFY